MGVYIKGMTKQQALQWLHYQMLFVFQVNDEDVIEVPEPHGDLIDRERIDYKNYKMHDGKGNFIVPDTFVDGVSWVNTCIYETPVVIEAEQ